MSCYQSQCWVLGVCQCCAWSVNSFSRLAVFTLANGATTFYRGGSSESCKTIDISSVGVTEPGHFAHRGPPRPPDDDYPHLSLGLSPAARSQHQQSSIRQQVAAGCRLEAMMFYLTIGSTYFVKTRTYVALFCPHELSIIFSGVMCLELCPL